MVKMESQVTFTYRISQFQTDLTKMIEVKINESVGRLEERIDKRLDVLTSNVDKNKTSCEHTLQRVKQAESIAQDASIKIINQIVAIQLKVEILLWKIDKMLHLSCNLIYDLD